LIGKAGAMNGLPLVGPTVAGTLRGLEGVVDVSLLFDLDTWKVDVNMMSV